MFSIVPLDYEWYTTSLNVHKEGLYSYGKLIIFVLMFVQLYMQCLTFAMYCDALLVASIIHITHTRNWQWIT